MRAWLVLLGCVLFLPALFLRDCWQPTETAYAQIAREMVETGEYLVPHLNGEPYSDKPPLFLWLSAGLRHLGLGARSGRIVAALASIGTLLLTFSLARLWFSRTAALLAAAVLATTMEFFWITQSGVLDPPLAFFTTLAVYGYFAGGRALPLFYVAFI